MRRSTGSTGSGRGEYEWAHTAMRYWPDRVTAACRTNRSYAIAHGLMAQVINAATTKAHGQLVRAYCISNPGIGDEQVLSLVPADALASFDTFRDLSAAIFREPGRLRGYVTRVLSTVTENPDVVHSTGFLSLVARGPLTVSPLASGAAAHPASAGDRRMARGAGRLRIMDPGDREEVWRLAEVLIEQTSIMGTGDCIHVATAILLGCSILVTEDRHLRHCVEHELLTVGDSRNSIRAALGQLTGVDELTLRALAVQVYHIWVERALGGRR